jgi:hypothetical protein
MKPDSLTRLRALPHLQLKSRGLSLERRDKCGGNFEASKVRKIEGNEVRENCEASKSEEDKTAPHRPEPRLSSLRVLPHLEPEDGVFHRVLGALQAVGLDDPPPLLPLLIGPWLLRIHTPRKAEPVTIRWVRIHQIVLQRKGRLLT